MPIWPVKGIEGSARPAGGREAPAHGGGSGAARRYRRAGVWR